MVVKELFLYPGQDTKGFKMPEDENEASHIFSVDKTIYDEKGDVQTGIYDYHMYDDMVTEAIAEHIKKGGGVKVLFID